MKFEITQYQNEKFYITLSEIIIFTDCQIANYLDLTLEEYRDILKASNGVSRILDNDEIEFTNIEDAERAVEYLEPYLILTKLTK